MVFGTPAHYRTFTIDKRSGGQRKITTPYPLLRSVQRIICSHILIRAPVHPSAHGYVKGRSCRTNAAVHLGQSVILKLDVADFFGSIKQERVQDVFRHLGYNERVSYFLSSLCCLNQCLPQGASSSPLLSNIIMYGLDKALHGLAAMVGLQYSRYADDITLSGDDINQSDADTVIQIVEAFGFPINRAKTRICGEDRRRVVTGISVGMRRLGIPRDRRRALRHEVHIVQRYGLSGLEWHRDSLRETQQRLIGRLSYWAFVEPDNRFPREALRYVRKIHCPS